MFVEFVVALLPFGTCIAYAVLIADFVPAAIQAIKPTDSVAAGRTFITIIIGSGALLPLCLLRNLSSLKFSSGAGVLSMIFASGVIVAGISDNKSTTVPLSTIARFDGGVFTAMSLISVAFTMHYNAQRYYQELVDRTLPLMSRIIFGAFSFAFVLYALVGCFGVLEFEDAVQSDIINNFLPTPVVDATRIFLSLAIIASFPLPFHGCRSNFLRLFFRLEGDDLSMSRWVSSPATPPRCVHKSAFRTDALRDNIPMPNPNDTNHSSLRLFAPWPFSCLSSAFPLQPTMWASS